MVLRFNLLHKDAKIPTRAYKGDAGLDCYAPTKVEVPPGGFLKVPLGISVEIPEGEWLSIESKSSNLSKGVRTDGGIVDSGYKGEIHCVVFNLGDRRFFIEAGQKLCQIILHATQNDGIVEQLGERGENGFGSSTGKC